MKGDFFIKAILITVILTGVQVFSGLVSGGSFDPVSLTADLISVFLVVAVLSVYASSSVFEGLKLCAAVFFICFTIGNLNIHIEALIFNVTDKTETLNVLGRGILSNLAASVLTALFFQNAAERMGSTALARRKMFGRLWRIGLGVLLYLVIYLTAGLVLSVVYPEMMEFYQGKIPPFGLIILTQILRGPIFVGIALFILRTTTLSRLKQAVLIGAVFSVLGGIAPLIPPNEFMPAYVRLGHGFEVGISNFLYGFILGRLLASKKSENDLSEGLDFRSPNAL